MKKNFSARLCCFVSLCNSVASVPSVVVGATRMKKRWLAVVVMALAAPVSVQQYWALGERRCRLAPRTEGAQNGGHGENGNGGYGGNGIT